ncbi:hypothetical protein HPB51_024689 [Rhipicephalus microplus]|uniref:Uncharacterized protein n=1 Tax=Rhipicephalus microplus TaxID=6941 RepID=A0A9J6E5A1_RHIMP|nr:hypothetical protein HPB51_024689 [Rhipicephalus microplus]
MADKAKPTTQKSALKPKSSKGQPAAKGQIPPTSKGEGIAAISAEGMPSPGSSEKGINPIDPSPLHNTGPKASVSERQSAQDNQVDAMESASNVTSLKDVVSAQEQRRDKPTGTSKSAVSSTKISKAGKPKAKSSVASPAPNAGTSKAKGTAARPTSNVPKDTGTVVTDSGLQRHGRVSGVDEDVVSESVGASKVKSSKVTLKSAEVSHLVSDDNKAASNPATTNRGKGKARSRVAMFAIADEDDDDKNDEQKAVRKRQYGRRKSVVAVAFAKLRKSIKAPQPNADQSSSEGTLDTRDQMSLILMAMVAGFLLVFMVVLMFIFFVGATAIPDGIACVTEGAKLLRAWAVRPL